MADVTIPSFIDVLEGIQINITIPPTQAFLTNQGYTYNQAGFTYNQLGVQYGGVTAASEDIIPSLMTFTETPRVQGAYDAYTQHGTTPAGNSGMLIGILGLTYP